MHLCFPDPYPDELLYSLCARFSNRMRYPHPSIPMFDLFGQKGCIAITDLPSRLGRLLNKLPQKDYYTLNNTINKHTLFPFYGAFMLADKCEWVKLHMEGTEIHAPSSFIVRLFCGVRLSEWLRFCSLCLAEDRRHFGECYWHREHQLPGINICIKHNVYLQNSSVHKRTARPISKFFSAEEAATAQIPIELNLYKDFDVVLLQIARKASWLLNQEGLSIDQFAYEGWAFQRGFSRDNGIVYLDRKKLLEKFRIRYDDNILQYFNCEFNESLADSWPTKIIYAPLHYHPIHHLLLIHFLKLKMEDLFISDVV